MTAQLPRVEHIYQNHLLDSIRWSHIEPRDDDIVVATPYKSGKAAFGVFLYGDGRVSTIRSDVDGKVFRNLLLMADNNAVPQIPSGDRPRGGRPGARQTQVVEIVRTSKGLSARLVSRSTK